MVAGGRRRNLSGMQSGVRIPDGGALRGLRRAAVRDAWNIAVVELETATRVAGMTPAAMRQAISALDTANAASQSSVLRNLRSTLSRGLDEVSAGRVSAAARLDSLLQHARDNLATATAHAR